LKKIIASLFIIIFTLYSCKTIYVKDKETTANILLKNLLRESEKIGDVTVSGMIRIKSPGDTFDGVYFIYIRRQSQR